MTDLHLVDTAGELLIAAEPTDGSPRPWVPIWLVCAGGQVYGRTCGGKYGRDGAESMVTAEATATTLRLHPQ